MEQPEIFELEPLFQDVQMAQVFADGKTFVDCLPKANTASILEKYLQQKRQPGFDLKNFVLQYFELPQVFAADYHTSPGDTTETHVQALWDILTREPDTGAGSLIPLPHPYIVPGGRFGEVYYWDSYFTMLGLATAGKVDMLENMVANFAHLINTQGFIPNGNRTYYLGRSQPPFFSLMVQLLAEIKGKEILSRYLPALQGEYNYWMKGMEDLKQAGSASLHVVKMNDGAYLNRYCDVFDTARPESYREDIELSHHGTQPSTTLFTHLRAGAESGWDYSSRWFKDGQTFTSINTASLVPVDLNCLLYHLEQIIATAFAINNNQAEHDRYSIAAGKRKTAIMKYCWNDEAGMFTDYDFVSSSQTGEVTLASVVPLFLRLATQQQADLVAESIQAKFLKSGGVVTTLKKTGQQWDAPNGWAPLQWMTIVGLENYSHHSLATTIAQRWTALNEKVFSNTGKMMEKYNVEDSDELAGGGEYPGQDGFGWTNGVYLALKKGFRTVV